MLQGQAQRMVVEGLRPERSGIGERAGIEGGGVLERVEQVGVFGGEGRRQHPAPGGDEITRGERVAIGPSRVDAQVKGVVEAIGADFPFFGRGGDGQGSAFVEGAEALEQGDGDVLVRVGRDELGVEFLGLGQVAHQQGAAASAGLGRGNALCTGGSQQTEDSGQKTDYR